MSGGGRRNANVCIVYQLTDDACTSVDSAQMYHNEKESGKAISDFLTSDANTESLTREDIHFTSKLASNSAYETARKAIKKSVKECGLGTSESVVYIGGICPQTTFSIHCLD